MASVSSDETSISPSSWITHAIIYSALFIFNAWVLIKELIHIKYGKVEYTTPYLKLWALSCITCGTLSQLFRAIRYFPFVCHFVYYVANMLSGWQAVFMGFYQLSRLYYCFSKNSVYSKHAYPQSLFRIMFIIGFILFMNYTFFAIIDDNLFSHCTIKSIDNTYYFYRQPLIILESFEMRTKWKNMMGLIYFIWDFVTLFLYIRQIRLLKNAQQRQDEIQGVMSRVLILTLFYQIPVILIMAFSIISLSLKWELYDWSFVGATTSILFSVSVSLMIEHNTSRYIKFLKIIKKMKLHILCLCCYSYIMRENIHEIPHENNQQNEVQTTTNDMREEEKTDDYMTDIIEEFGGQRPGEDKINVSYASNHGHGRM